MVRIPTFARQQLASSVVGTPGVDTSGVDTMNALARLGGSVVDATFPIARERQQVADTSEAAKLLVDYKLDSDNVLIEHKNNNATQPVESIPTLRQTLGDRLDAMASNISSPTVRNMVIRNGQSVISSRLDEANTWAQKQLLVNTMNNVNTTIDGLAKQSYTIFGDQNTDLNSKVAKLQEYLNEGAKQIPTASRALSPEQFEAFQKEVPTKIISGALYGSMEKNPAEVLALVQSGQLNGLLDPEQIQKFEKDATAKIKNVADQMQLDQMVSDINSHVEDWGKLQNNELTLAEIDAKPDSSWKETLREIYLKANPLTEKQSYQEYAGIFDDFTNMSYNKKKKTVKASLEEINAFQDRVLKARAQGVLTKEQANDFIEKTSMAEEKKIDAALKKGGWSKMAKGNKIMRKWLEDEGFEKNADMKGRLYDKFASIMRDNDPNPEDAAQLAIRALTLEENPRAGLVAGTPNSIMTANGDEKKILPGQSKIRVDGQAKKKGIIKRDPVTGVRARVYEDGSFEVIKD